MGSLLPGWEDNPFDPPKPGSNPPQGTDPDPEGILSTPTSLFHPTSQKQQLPPQLPGSSWPPSRGGGGLGRSAAEQRMERGLEAARKRLSGGSIGDDLGPHGSGPQQPLVTATPATPYFDELQQDMQLAAWEQILGSARERVGGGDGGGGGGSSRGGGGGTRGMKGGRDAGEDTPAAPRTPPRRAPPPPTANVHHIAASSIAAAAKLVSVGSESGHPCHRTLVGLGLSRRFAV
jgi:hypothetical protein